jgi:RHS repeat-associated protein
MRRVLANQGDSIDPYLLTDPSVTFNQGTFFINDPRYALYYWAPVDPPFVVNAGPQEDIYNSTVLDYGGNAIAGGENCVLPRAVYKVYAQGTWLTAESDWPAYFNNEEPVASARCGLPLFQYDGSQSQPFNGGPAPWCGFAGNNVNYVAPPTGVNVEQNGPGGIRVSWTPPSGVGASDIAGYYVYVFRTNGSGTYLTETVQRPLPFATVGPDVTTFVVTGLARGSLSYPGPYYFQVHSFDSVGRVSYAAETSMVIGDPGIETADTKPARAVKNILWTMNDDVYSRTRKGVKLVWKWGGVGNGSLIGFRVYRSTSPIQYGCALLAPGSQTVPLPPYTSVCQNNGAASSDVTAAPAAVYFLDSTAVQGVTYYYRITQVEQAAGGVYHETDLADTDQIPALPLRYDWNVLPPPQGFSAYAPQNGTSDMGGIYLQWCAVPDVDAYDPMPQVQEYWVYRGRTDHSHYKLLAKIPRACLENDASGHPRRCEITEANACISYVGATQPCGTITPTTTCGGANELPCAIVDKSLYLHLDAYPTTDYSAGSQANSNFTYWVTAVGSDPASESLPSLSDEGWLNYKNGSPWLERRDPEGIPAHKVCGQENVRLQHVPESEPVAPEPSGQAGADPTTVSGLTAPYRVIGQGMNPYSPPARFLFYHQDHLGSPRVILDDAGTPVTHHYLPFGEERPTTLDPTQSTKAFTGHERDVETGLDYMMARYYSSSLARFMAVDPGDDTDPEDPQSWNKYAYVRNNPLNTTDPKGTQGMPFPTSQQQVDQLAATARVQQAQTQGRASEAAAQAETLAAVGGAVCEAAPVVGDYSAATAMLLAAASATPMAPATGPSAGTMTIIAAGAHVGAALCEPSPEAMGAIASDLVGQTATVGAARSLQQAGRLAPQAQAAISTVFGMAMGSAAETTTQATAELVCP